MKGKQIAEWALAASVLVGVPVGGVMYPSSPVLAQRNQGDNFEALFKRAVELTQQGKYAEAERLYDRVLTILNRELPKLSPQQQQAIRSQEQKIVALAGINRGLLYASQGRDAEARQIWTESIGLLEQALGRNHPDVLKMRQAIATYAQQQGSVLSPSDAVQKFIQKTLVENASIAFPNSGLQPLINQVVELSKQRQYIKVDLLNGQIFKSLKKMVSNSTSLTGKQKELIEAFLYFKAINKLNIYLSQNQSQSDHKIITGITDEFERDIKFLYDSKDSKLKNLWDKQIIAVKILAMQILVAERYILIDKQFQEGNRIGGIDSAKRLLSLVKEMAYLFDTSPEMKEKIGALLFQFSKILQFGILETYKSLKVNEDNIRNPRFLTMLEEFVNLGKSLLPNLESQPETIATILEIEGLLLTSKANYTKAEALLQRSLAIREEAVGTNHTDVAKSLDNLAFLYQEQNQYSKAEALYQRSLAIREKALGVNHLEVADTLDSWAGLYQKQRQYEKAEALYQRSLAIREQVLGANHPDIVDSLSKLVGLYQQKGQYDKVESLLQRSLAIREKANDSYTVNSVIELAVFYLFQNQISATLPLFIRGLDLEETKLAQGLFFGSEQDKRAYLETYSGTTNAAISFHLQYAPTNPRAARLALTTILRRKGRVLDTLSQNLNRLRQQLSPADQERLTHLSALRTQVAQIAFNPNPTDQQRQQLQLLNTQAEQIETELSRSNATFAQTTQKVTLEAVQKAIPQNAALVEFIEYQPFNPKAPPSQRWGSPRYAVYVLTATGEPRFADLGSASEIDALVSQYYNVVRDHRLPREPLRNLDAKIMAPVRQLVGTANHLLIAPDGQLNLVSFAALVDEKNRYLVENYLITYLTSGRDLLRLQNTPPKANPPLIVADPVFDKPGSSPVQIASADRGNLRSVDLTTLKFGPLPATAIEGETIAKLLPNSRLFTQAQATETVVKTSSNPRILHLATHGFFLKPAPTTQAKDGSRNLPSENPLVRSGLAFSGFNMRQGGGDDGVLTALEITGMDLRGTQLVVLSACETGLGDVQSGEGVYGLRRAFTLAGAQSQVMTLWRVDDNATKDLMVNYYQRLAKGEGRGEALRQAQLTMLRSPNYAHPKYWSGMIPVGDWRGMSP